MSSRKYALETSSEGRIKIGISRLYCVLCPLLEVVSNGGCKGGSLCVTGDFTMTTDLAIGKKQLMTHSKQKIFSLFNDVYEELIPGNNLSD